MDARELVQSGAFGPDTLKAMGQAFNLAWADIAATFGNDPQDIEKARLRLARAVLEVTHEGRQDTQALKAAALQSMAMNHKKRWLATDQG